MEVGFLAMRDHKKLRAFELADELAVLVYRHTRDFPREELFGLVSQMRNEQRFRQRPTSWRAAAGVRRPTTCDSLIWLTVRCENWNIRSRWPYVWDTCRKTMSYCLFPVKPPRSSTASSARSENPERTSSLQPATSSLQPATSSLQPASSSLQPPA